MQKLKKLGALSLGLIAALINLVMGLLLGIIQLIALNNPTIAGMFLDPSVYILGYWIILIYPLVYGIVGFISGLVLAWLYNLFAKLTGGIKIELVDKPSRKSKRK